MKPSDCYKYIFVVVVGFYYIYEQPDFDLFGGGFKALTQNPAEYHRGLFQVRFNIF